jgi:hypothetical protein
MDGGHPGPQDGHPETMKFERAIKRLYGDTYWKNGSAKAPNRNEIIT